MQIETYGLQANKPSKRKKEQEVTKQIRHKNLDHL